MFHLPHPAGDHVACGERIGANPKLRLVACIFVSVFFHFVFLMCCFGGFQAAGWNARWGGRSAYLRATVVLVEGLSHDRQKENASPDSLGAPSNSSDKVAPERIAGGQGQSSSGYLPVSANRYRVPAELDKLPVPLMVPPLDGPEMLGTTRHEVVKVKVWVATDGRVVKVDFIAGGELFADRVREAFSNARFIPGEIGNAAVPSVVVIEVEYPELSAGILPPAIK